ncbi:MAG TPA: alpha-glucosidase [Anaerolineales bacterium]|nr:alpha-glucosidase [Anaerolineales bacterium]
MTAKLDYLKDLGIDAIWLSPHFPSPQFDVGYDISDYEDVAPEYGTLTDFQRFLDGAHQRGLRVILDLVLNHTSHLHSWFLESRSSRNPSAKRDWYIWRSGVNGGPPNNWLSPFGGPAWEYDAVTDQYYYHYFLKEQPDLNWRNPKVKKTMWEVVRFWLDMGVDGYRLDAIGTIFEDPAMPDHEGELTDELRRKLNHGFPSGVDPEVTAAWQTIYRHQQGQPGVHELMQELRQVVDEYPDRVLVGESAEISYYGDGRNELHLVFNFPLMRTNRLTPAWIRANQRDRLSQLPPGAWPCNTLNNHDATRVLSRYGDGEHNDAIARTSLALMLTLRGTPFLYNGEEIGMSDYFLNDISLFVDPPSIMYYHQEVANGMPPQEALARATRDTRDRSRTPFQWDATSNAGFSPEGVRTWLPVNPNYAEGINIADQESDPKSMLRFYKDLLRLRKQNPALISGKYEPLHEASNDYLAFLRESDSPGQTCLVVLNLSDQTHRLKYDLPFSTARCIFSNHKSTNESFSLEDLEMIPFEILIAELHSAA